MSQGLAPPRFFLDIVNADQVIGWCLDPSPSVVVSVGGGPAKAATCGLPRPDVARAHPAEPHASLSGFVYNFTAEDFAHVTTSRVVVGVQVQSNGWAESVSREVALPSYGSDTPARGPYPVPVLRLLAGLDPDLTLPAWSDEQMLEAARAIELLASRGSRTLSGLSRYLGSMLALWARAAYTERNFPRVNHGRLPSAKDGLSVQSSALEMFAIAHHLTVLDSHGVGGVVLEFGCFKGFSTSVLSHAAHALGRQLHVFDSFSGLPPSDTGYYQAGDFCGGIDEVRRNVGEFGCPGSVTYHEGYFSDSVPRWPRVPVACVWMDVDLESSADDALQVFECLDRAGALFSHECLAQHFVGRNVRSERSPGDVVMPIIDAFGRAGRRLEGRFVAGNTGAFWDPDSAVPVLSTPALELVRDLACRMA